MRYARAAKKLQTGPFQQVTRSLVNEIWSSASRRWDALIPFPGKIAPIEFSFG
jgi:hypothetical protein